MEAETDCSSTDLSTADLADLQGRWEQVYLEVDGISDPPDDLTASDALTVIIGQSFSVRRATGEVLLEGTFELDASTFPKSITWIDSMGADTGKRLPAIYKLEGDRFTFVAADEDAPRPRVFHTEPGLTMRGFLRR